MEHIFCAVKVTKHTHEPLISAYILQYSCLFFIFSTQLLFNKNIKFKQFVSNSNEVCLNIFLTVCIYIYFLTYLGHTILLNDKLPNSFKFHIQ